MIGAVVGRLRCPVCLAATELVGAGLVEQTVRCGGGHSFDVARQGYLNLRVGRTRGVVGDTAEMVAARERFLGAGRYAPLANALVELATPVLAGVGDRAPLVVEVGAGTGYYLAAVVEACPGAVGVASDVSKYALRRAARLGPRIGAVAVDVADRMPFSDASAALLLDVFAPRNAAEMARVLHPHGRLLVVTPGPNHLAEVMGPLGLVSVDDRKNDRVDVTFADHLVRTSREPLTYPMRLGSAEIVDLVLMGPAGHHTDDTRLRADVRSRWPDGVDVTASFVVSSYSIPTSTVRLNC